MPIQKGTAAEAAELSSCTPRLCTGLQGPFLLCRSCSRSSLGEAGTGLANGWLLSQCPEIALAGEPLQLCTHQLQQPLRTPKVLPSHPPEQMDKLQKAQVLQTPASSPTAMVHSSLQDMQPELTEVSHELAARVTASFWLEKNFKIIESRQFLTLPRLVLTVCDSTSRSTTALPL